MTAAPRQYLDRLNDWCMIYTMNKIIFQKMSENNEKRGLPKAAKVIAEVIGGVRRHESLSQAASYALLMDAEEVASLLHDKLIERNFLINRLMRLHIESDGALLPGVPVQGGLPLFIAIEELAKINPSQHPILGEIAALEKLKYMAGADDCTPH